MSFEITTGLFTLDNFIDHHAVLGVPVNAEAQAVRKRYLKIARKLHPDSLANQSDSHKQLATQILSKWVNPAYEMIFQEKNRKEYQVLVRLKGQQAVQQKVGISQFSEEAQKLAKTSNIDHEYQQLVNALGASQYDNLDTLGAVIGKLSELNLVYMMRKGGNPMPAAKPTTAPSTPANPMGGARPTPTAGRPMTEPTGASPVTVLQTQAQRISLADGYLRRAEEYVRKRAYSQAILELRDGLRADPKDSRCHSLMGIVYLHQKQATMAKVSIKRALELNPEDPRGLEAKRHLEKLGHKIDGGSSGSSASTSQPPSSANANAAGQKENTAKKGGLFGGLFGGKKK